MGTTDLLAELGALSRAEALAHGDLPAFLTASCRAAGAALAVDRVSVWAFEADRHAIRLLHARHPGHEGPLEMRIRATEAPTYFAALDADPLVAADDALTDLRLADLRDLYLIPAGIGATLDAPIYRGPQLVGVVCLEHVGAARAWTRDEQLFAAGLGDVLSLAFTLADQREVEERRRARDAQLQATLASTGLGLIRVEAGTHALTLGGAAEALLSGAPPTFEALLDRVHPEDAGSVRAALAPGEERRVALAFRVAAPGGHRWMELRGWMGAGASPVVAGTLADVTTQRDLERKLVEAQQLEMLGQLAGGVAHNFNNLLAIVAGYAELLGPIVADRPDAARYAAAIGEAAERSAAITKQLLALTRSRSAPPTVIDAAELGRRVVALMGPLLGSRVRLRAELPDAPAYVEVDVPQLEQLIVNLLLNARDAVGAGGEVCLRITTGGGVDPIPSGAWVVVGVEDDGEGLTPEATQRAFEPFFTTRPAGRGSGLGLPTCLAIATRAGGGMALAPREGRGTRALAWFPQRARAPVAVEVAAAPAPVRYALVVDDQKPVADLLHRILTRSGWQVGVASDGDAAIAIAAASTTLDLLVSDVMIPGTRGDRLVARIRDHHPHVAVVFVSGYTADELVDRKQLPPGTRFLAKPFRPAELLTAAELALADRAT